MILNDSEQYGYEIYVDTFLLRVGQKTASDASCSGRPMWKKVCSVFLVPHSLSPDAVLCGWPGSKHQLTNKLANPHSLRNEVQAHDTPKFSLTNLLLLVLLVLVLQRDIRRMFKTSYLAEFQSFAGKNYNIFVKRVWTKFRCGVTNIAVDRNSYKYLNVTEMIFPLCKSAKQHERHFTLCCPAVEKSSYVST